MTYDGTNLEAVKAMARNGKIVAVVWAHRNHKIVKTKKEATELARSMAVDATVHEYDAETLDRLWSWGNFKYRLVRATGELQITERQKRTITPRRPVGV